MSQNLAKNGNGAHSDLSTKKLKCIVGGTYLGNCEMISLIIY